MEVHAAGADAYSKPHSRTVRWEPIEFAVAYLKYGSEYFEGVNPGEQTFSVAYFAELLEPFLVTISIMNKEIQDNSPDRIPKDLPMVEVNLSQKGYAALVEAVPHGIDDEPAPDSEVIRLD